MCSCATSMDHPWFPTNATAIAILSDVTLIGGPQWVLEVYFIPFTWYRTKFRQGHLGAHPNWLSLRAVCQTRHNPLDHPKLG
jgi:hypothetical protein